MIAPAVGPRVLLAGATGLVGSQCLQGWLDDRGWRGQLLAPTRRDLGRRDHRLLAVRTDLGDPAGDSALAKQCRDALAGAPLDAYVCCLGTTLKTAGSREAFVAVDRDLVLRLAQVARELGARQAVLVSSVGASRQSANFYLRVKGEVEDALASMEFERVDIVRPGLLLGERRERRPGEALARALAPLYNPLLRGKLGRYRAVGADAVARAVIALTGTAGTGRFIHATPQIEKLAD